MKLKINPHSLTGYPQLYIIDPDRHVIEINAERLD
jgi:glyoxylase I family protein